MNIIIATTNETGLVYLNFVYFGMIEEYSDKSRFVNIFYLTLFVTLELRF